MIWTRRRLLRTGAAAGGLAALAGCAGTRRGGADWLPANAQADARRIVASIARTDIPARDFHPGSFGAMTPGTADARPAILAAIAAAHQAGGGRVVIPAGLWLSDGPVHLRSNVELHLSEGAHVRFLANLDRYLPPVRTRWEGTEVWTYSPLVYAQDCENIALTGPGTLDGQGKANWLPWRDTQRPIQAALRDMGRDGVPVDERRFVGERRLRPHFVQFNRCKRVLVDGPTLIDSPFWMVHPLYCEDVIVRNVRFVSDHLNSDGVDPDSSRRVLVEGCDFNVGDDGVALKSGRDQDGWRVGIPCQDIVVRNCVYSGHAGGGMSIGSEMSGGVRNVHVDGFRIPKARHTLYFKANLDRGGLISDIHIRNIEAGETASLIVFTNDYHSYRGGDFPPRFERVSVTGVRSQVTGTGISVDGHERAPVRDVLIRDVEMAQAQWPLKLAHAERLTLEGVRANGRAVELADAIPVDNEKLGGY